MRLALILLLTTDKYSGEHLICLVVIGHKDSKIILGTFTYAANA